MAPESIRINQSFSEGSETVTGVRSMDGNESVEIPSRDLATISILPDDALLEIFHFCVEGHISGPRQWWKPLIDVCRRWRNTILASPHRLDLHIVCTERTPTRTSLDIWPPFPIMITSFTEGLDEGQDNIIAALERHDRVISIYIRNQKCLALETFAAAMQKPFPVLRDLDLSSSAKIAPVLHKEFLGGFAPCLQSFVLNHISFPGFPRLASFAPYLASLYRLDLYDIPINGYISPEAMATCLASLPSLEDLFIVFRSPLSRPDRIGLPPPMRAVLPALTRFHFKGVIEYLEDLVARIDTPALFVLYMYLFMDLMFHVPQLNKFIARTERIGPYISANITFSATHVQTSIGRIQLQISCKEPDWQASSMAQLYNQLSPVTSHTESLEIRKSTPGQAWQGNGIDPTQWFELFDLFPTVQELYIHDQLRPLVARALQGLTGERATEVLPTLRSIFFRGPSPPRRTREDIETFIAARQHSDHPVEVHWD